MNLYAVVGKPVLHSLSPRMHNAAFQALRLPARYVRLAADDARRAGPRAADHLGRKGSTSPLPSRRTSPPGALRRLSVEYLQAANTVVTTAALGGLQHRPAGRRRRARRRGCRLEGTAVVLGAAGRAPRRTRWTLGRQGHAGQPHLNGRSRPRGGWLPGLRAGLQGAQAALRGARIVVNATSTDERVVEPQDCRAARSCSRALRLPLAAGQDARASGCLVIDGRAWLLHQGEESFRAFAGRDAPRGRMEKALAAPAEPRAPPGARRLHGRGQEHHRPARRREAEAALPGHRPARRPARGMEVAKCW
jgi:shikimate dehydrogenase